MATVIMRREGDKNQGEPILFPKGKYRTKLLSYEQASGVSKVKKNGKETGQEREWSALRVTLKFVGGENAGHEQDFFLFDGREAQVTLFEAAGFDFDRDADQIEVDLDELIGLDLNVFLEVNKKGDYNNVVRFEPAPRTKPAKVKSPVLPNEEPEDEEEEEG